MKSRPGTREVVAFLRDPESYPRGVGAVEAIETHMAWVFLAGDRAYKLKKPMRRPFLDFSTVQARWWSCREEVRLNRRLAPDVYLGVLPLTVGTEGLALGGRGEPVDWLVEMRRLPREAMLDRRIGEGSATPADVRAAAELLGAFYADARAVTFGPGEYARRLRRDVEEDARELAICHPPGGPGPNLRVVAVLRRFVEREATLLEARVREGRVVEGHGDLRPEHVFLGPPPAVIDCIEFNRDFRMVDAVDDLAFLALECERLGAPALGRAFLDVYAERTGDSPPARLIEFHAARRALLRAKIAVWHLDDGKLPADAERWVALCRDYLELAGGHASATGARRAG